MERQGSLFAVGGIIVILIAGYVGIPTMIYKGHVISEAIVGSNHRIR